jgi:hypothetical protein
MFFVAVHDNYSHPRSTLSWLSNYYPDKPHQ